MYNHDWNKYREQFPTRYWQEGSFDEKLSLLLDQLFVTYKFKTAVDVGGGILGTIALKNFSQKHNISVDLLDPFVSNKPDWIRNKTDWNNNEKYDLIVARGSINYLTTEQLKKLKSMMNVPAIFVANTFLTPPSKEWSEREVLNMHGEKGLEKSRLIGNVVEHRIIFPNYDITHNFFFHSLEEYERAFGNVEVDTYAKNSSLILVKN